MRVVLAMVVVGKEGREVGEEEEVVEPWREPSAARLLTASHRAVERSFTVEPWQKRKHQHLVKNGSRTTTACNASHFRVNNDMENSILCALA